MAKKRIAYLSGSIYSGWVGQIKKLGFWNTPIYFDSEKEAARERTLRAYEASEQKKIEEARKRKLEKKTEKAAHQQEVQPSLFEF